MIIIIIIIIKHIIFVKCHSKTIIENTTFQHVRQLKLAQQSCILDKRLTENLKRTKIPIKPCRMFACEYNLFGNDGKHVTAEDIVHFCDYDRTCQGKNGRDNYSIIHPSTKQRDRAIDVIIAKEDKIGNETFDVTWVVHNNEYSTSNSGNEVDSQKIVDNFKKELRKKCDKNSKHQKFVVIVAGINDDESINSEAQKYKNIGYDVVLLAGDSMKNYFLPIFRRRACFHNGI